MSKGGNAKFYALRAKTDDKDPSPFIGRSEKTPAGWEITSKTDAFDGHLREITHESYETKQHGIKYKCKMKFMDADGSMNYLDSNFNNLLYSVLNSLAGVKAPDKVEINVYLGKLKEGADRRWPSAKVLNNGKDAPWLYQPEDLPKPVKTMVGSQTVYDDSEPIRFWQKEIENINARLPKNDPIRDPRKTNDPEFDEPGSRPEEVYNSEDDDLAFEETVDKSTGEITTKTDPEPSEKSAPAASPPAQGAADGDPSDDLPF